MKEFKKEFLVGLLVIGVILLMGVFAWLMGTFRPFSNTVRFHLLFNFAGGVEEGSPVRVAGVKVGKVEKISFVPGGPEALTVTISVSKVAAASVRKDSRFYVNMAGIIGERYIEISPGTAESELLAHNDTVRGVDPPRIDQLLSQGYGVFGEVQKFLEENRETVADFLGQLPVLLKDMTTLLKRNDWRKLVELIDNVNGVAKDLRVITVKLRSEKTQQVLDKTYDIIDRAHQIDRPLLNEFLQKEGIRARIF